MRKIQFSSFHLHFNSIREACGDASRSIWLHLNCWLQQRACEWATAFVCSRCNKETERVTLPSSENDSPFCNVTCDWLNYSHVALWRKKEKKVVRCRTERKWGKQEEEWECQGRWTERGPVRAARNSQGETNLKNLSGPVDLNTVTLFIK